MLLEGKPIAEKIKDELKKEVAALAAKAAAAPKLVALQIGNNPSSAVYMKAQAKTAEAVGIGYEIKTLSENISQANAEDAIRSLNKDKSVTAILVQLPVPKGIDSKKLANIIAPSKDAEGVHSENLGKILLGSYKVGPCTAMAVMELLKSTNVKLYGKEVVVVGHSDIVGKPLAAMLLNEFATTTVCHIATSDKGLLKSHVARAEVLIVAVGKAGVIKGDWVKDGAIVIDVGINRVGDKIVGDVEFEEASKRASYITPVPGGVGPVTTAMLMRNVVELYRQGIL